MSFADNLRAVRHYARLSQRELAALVGVTGPAVAAWETGKAYPRQRTLVKIADALGCTVDDLTSDEPVDLSRVSPPCFAPATQPNEPKTETLAWDEQELLGAYRELPADGKLRLLNSALVLLDNAQNGGGGG